MWTVAIILLVLVCLLAAHGKGKISDEEVGKYMNTHAWSYGELWECKKCGLSTIALGMWEIINGALTTADGYTPVPVYLCQKRLQLV